jgi:hypothetical protein
MITALYIGNEKLDLFKDDNIVIKNSVSKIEDITKVFTDTSNSFSVPASDNNNRIFKHFYNASINNAFDARKLVLGAIYLDGLHYKSGNFKLNKVILKSQKAHSYSLDFFGLLTELKELLKDDKLSSLSGLSFYNFPFDYGTVKFKLINNKTSSTQANIPVVGTILSPKRYIYDSNTSTNNTDSLKNLADNNTSTNSGLDWTDLNFSIQNLTIIQYIEDKYNLTFSRDFFGTQAFTGLYLLLNGGKSFNQFYQQITFDTSGDPTVSGNVMLNNSTLLNQRIFFDLDVNNTTTPDFDIIVKSGNTIISEKTNPTRTRPGIIYRTAEFQSFNNLTFFIRSRSIINYSVIIVRINSNDGASYTTTTTAKDISGDFDVPSKMPDIKIIDYLKGLFQTYKLIVRPRANNNLYITTINDYYRNGTIRDITKLIDFTETPVTVGKMLNEINYKFQEGQTLLSKQFRNINEGIDYGNLEEKILDDTGELIDGESLDYELPFENMVYERLNDLDSVVNSNVVYGFLANDSLEPTTIKPHLHYVNNVLLDSKIKVIVNDTTTETLTNLNLPSHTLGYIAPQFSTVFNEEFNEYNGERITNTLYSNYHRDYIDLIFNKKKRDYNFTIKNAPLELVKNIDLNDAIVIKGRGYRINDFDTNIITRDISLNLINSLNQSLTPIKYYTADNCSADLGINIAALDVNEFSCPVIYFNTLQSGSFQKVCPTGSTGNSVTYSIPAGDFSSTISQAAADAKAEAKVTANGQNNANSLGVCTVDSTAPTLNLSTAASPFYSEFTNEIIFSVNANTTAVDLTTDNLVWSQVTSLPITISSPARNGLFDWAVFSNLQNDVTYTVRCVATGTDGTTVSADLTVPVAVTIPQESITFTTDFTGSLSASDILGVTLTNLNWTVTGGLSSSGTSNTISLSGNVGGAVVTIFAGNIDTAPNFKLQSKNVTSVDITKAVGLNKVLLTSNNLSSIDLSENTSLTNVTIGNNTGITSLDLSNNTALTRLSLSNLGITSLDVSASVLLEVIICVNTDVTSLDLSSNTELTAIEVYNNNLSDLNIKNTNNTNLTIFRTNGNSNLTCILVDNKTYADANFVNSASMAFDSQNTFSDTTCP